MRIFASAAAISLSALWTPTAAPNSVAITLPTPDGAKVLVGVDYLWFTQDAQTISLGQAATGQGNAQIDSADCRHELDLPRIKRGALALLNSRHLHPNSTLGDGQLYIITTPKLSSGTAVFYAFAAAMTACVNICSVRVSAFKIVAPYDATTIDMRRATKEDDDITGALIDVGQAEFEKCAR